MNFSELEKLLARANRFRARLQSKDGDGFKWSCFDGETEHFYSITGVRDLNEIEDEVAATFIWMWNLKDYVKKYVVNEGGKGSWVEDKINSNQLLCECADIANSIKHGGLDRKPRSKQSPMLGKLSYQIPHTALGSIVIGASDVGLNVNNPDMVELKMPLLNKKGAVIGSAFEHLDKALVAWENIVSEAKQQRNPNA